MDARRCPDPGGSNTSRSLNSGRRPRERLSANARSSMAFARAAGRSRRTPRSCHGAARGSSLERLVQEFGPVDPERTVGLLRQVCHSLGEAHMSRASTSHSSSRAILRATLAAPSIPTHSGWRVGAAGETFGIPSATNSSRAATKIACRIRVRWRCRLSASLFRRDAAGDPPAVEPPRYASIAFAEPRRFAGRVTYETASDPSNATGSKDYPSAAR